MPQSAPGAHVVVILIDVIVVEILEAHRPLGQHNTMVAPKRFKHQIKHATG